MFGKKKNEDYSVKTVKVGVDKLTTIALGTMVKGTITVEGDLRLDGIIEGNVSCRGKVVIGPQGRIKGNVTCTGAVLHGMLQGDIQVAEDLIMKSGCTMNGDVYTCKLEILKRCLEKSRFGLFQLWLKVFRRLQSYLKKRDNHAVGLLWHYAFCDLLKYQSDI